MTMNHWKQRSKSAAALLADQQASSATFDALEVQAIGYRYHDAVRSWRRQVEGSEESSRGTAALKAAVHRLLAESFPLIIAYLERDYETTGRQRLLEVRLAGNWAQRHRALVPRPLAQRLAVLVRGLGHGRPSTQSRLARRSKQA